MSRAYSTGVILSTWVHGPGEVSNGVKNSTDYGLCPRGLSWLRVPLNPSWFLPKYTEQPCKTIYIQCSCQEPEVPKASHIASLGGSCILHHATNILINGKHGIFDPVRTPPRKLSMLSVLFLASDNLLDMPRHYSTSLITGMERHASIGQIALFGRWVSMFKRIFVVCLSKLWTFNTLRKQLVWATKRGVEQPRVSTN